MKTQTKNTLCSLIQHFTAILCGLILPREILLHYYTGVTIAAYGADGITEIPTPAPSDTDSLPVPES